MSDLPVYYEAKEIWFSYYQLKHFLLPNLIDLRRGDYPPEPDEYRAYYENIGWLYKQASSYEGRNSNRLSIAPFIRAAELAAEIDYRVEGIKTYSIIIDTISVPINGLLVTDAFTENLVLNSDLLFEAEIMLNFISGWTRRKESFQSYRKRIRK